jgi:hypothetical protein
MNGQSRKVYISNPQKQLEPTKFLKNFLSVPWPLLHICLSPCPVAPEAPISRVWVGTPLPWLSLASVWITYSHFILTLCPLHLGLNLPFSRCLSRVPRPVRGMLRLMVPASCHTCRIRSQSRSSFSSPERISPALSVLASEQHLIKLLL